MSCGALCCGNSEESQTFAPHSGIDQAKPEGIDDVLVAMQGVMDPKRGHAAKVSRSRNGAAHTASIAAQGKVDLPDANMKLGGLRKHDAAAGAAGDTRHSIDTAGAPRTASVSTSNGAGEKERLQEQVNIFSRQAMKGSPCTLVKRGTDGACTCVECLYKIDKSFSLLSVVSKTSGMDLVKIRITHIQDIYSFSDDGEAAFPESVVQAVAGRQRTLLLMLVFKESAESQANPSVYGDEALSRCYIVEESDVDRDRFLDCLKVLCIYAQMSPRHR